MEVQPMKALARIILTVAAVCASASAAAAQEPRFGDFTFTYGFESALRPRHEWEGTNTQKLKGSLKIVLTPKIYFRLGNTSFTSKQNADGTRTSGVGATSLVFGADPVKEDKTGIRRHPSLTVEYSVILPSASKAFGAFRPTNHYVTAAVAKSFGESIISGGAVTRRNTFEVDVGAFFAEKQTGEYSKTPELTLAYARTLDSLQVGKYSYRVELYSSAPTKFGASEIYVLNKLSVALKGGAKFTAGVRAGLTPNSPRALFSGSISFKSSFR
jgi:hypothetical protein